MSVVRVEENGLVYRNATMADTEAVWQLMVAEFYPRTELCCCLRMRIPQDVEILHTLLPAIIRMGKTGRCSTNNGGAADGATQIWAAAYSKVGSAVYRMFDHLSCSVDLAKLYKVVIERFPSSSSWSPSRIRGEASARGWLSCRLSWPRE
uniref:N-acetyltransferase domain-containing protein n=1 Tax=Macrostomum lignano TaxID=282301 RepID=A0A1I8FCG2_9PLAT